MTPRTYIKIEYFEYIEKAGSVTVDGFANKFRIPRGQAGSWLSKWTARGYLTKDKGGYEKRRGRQRAVYRAGPKWWGELAYGASREFG